ncbi:hypothetical protein C9E82_05105 [Paracoccus siganidrum]|uniref:ASCH domain-containing protein n=3 Tax=Paracoccus siganidrum TaxID=1276757 RepID=A0A419A6Z9_9RHOB|nr:hypothetical protein D3P05_10825 [Paracoccus siganidrum]RMC39358.1 hypothetical protein C9E82_05105 [Paracoccus siganidrum]
MADRPILFSGPMVRAILDGRKSQTRRILNIRGHKSFSEFGPSDTPGYDWHFRDAHMRWHDLRDSRLRELLPYAPGDRLWVRETWTARMEHGWTIADARSRMYREEILYKADGHDSIDGWWPSIHMPREFSRLTLIVTDVRVQRLQDISEADALAEGVERDSDGWRDYQMPTTQCCGNARDSFRTLWDSLNAGRGYGWDRNPWVAAVSFQAHRCNIDKMDRAAGQEGGGE